jgi:hypothetical protein
MMACLLHLSTFVLQNMSFSVCCPTEPQPVTSGTTVSYRVSHQITGIANTSHVSGSIVSRASLQK